MSRRPCGGFECGVSLPVGEGPADVAGGGEAGRLAAAQGFGQDGVLDGGGVQARVGVRPRHDEALAVGVPAGRPRRAALLPDEHVGVAVAHYVHVALREQHAQVAVVRPHIVPANR